ncbi:MAG: hypothetical protein ACR2JE_17915 [Acidobacteriaceae bacterium]
MFTDKGPLQIIGADRVEGGVIITFSNGSSVFYQTQSLFDARDQGGNRSLGDDGDWGIPGILVDP